MKHKISSPGLILKTTPAWFILSLFVINSYCQDTINLGTFPAGATLKISFDVKLAENIEDKSDTIIITNIIFKGDSVRDFYSYDPEVFYFDSTYATVTYFNFVEDTTSTPTNSDEIDYQGDILSDLLVYPNPNNGVFNVEFNLNSKVSSLNLSVYNMLGVEVYKEELKNYQGLFKKQFDIPFKPGICIITLSDNEFRIKKMISVYSE